MMSREGKEPEELKGKGPEESKESKEKEKESESKESKESKEKDIITRKLENQLHALAFDIAGKNPKLGLGAMVVIASSLTDDGKHRLGQVAEMEIKYRKKPKPGPQLLQRRNSNPEHLQSVHLPPSRGSFRRANSSPRMILAKPSPPGLFVRGNIPLPLQPLPVPQPPPRDSSRSGN